MELRILAMAISTMYLRACIFQNRDKLSDATKNPPTEAAEAPARPTEAADSAERGLAAAASLGFTACQLLGTVVEATTTKAQRPFLC